MKYLLILITLSSVLFAKIPALSFIALEKESWHIVVCNEDGVCHKLKTDQEPRTYDYDFVTDRLVYVGSDKNVYLVTDDHETTLLKSAKNAYTEPLFVNHGKDIMLVELVNGNSKKTRIITVDPKNQKIKVLHSQYSTALEPFMNNNRDLYYANVSCVDGCNKIIQEIWHKDLLTGEADQLTLLNALSHQPRSNRENSHVYFSSNKGGNYHIWVYDMDLHISKQLTFGNVTDGFPSPCNTRLIFLRRIENRTIMMQISKDGTLTELKITKDYTKIRNLKVKQ